jgi:hypothetical protein
MKQLLLVQKITRRYLLPLFLLFQFFNTPALAENAPKDDKINLIVNTVKENLFSTWFNGGWEFESFVGSEKDFEKVNITDNKFSIYRYHDAFLLIPTENDTPPGSFERLSTENMVLK